MYEAECLGNGIAKRKIVNMMMSMMVKLQRKKLLPLYNDPSVIINAFTQCLATQDDRKQYLSQIQAPTLLFGADHDQFFDAETYQETAQLIPNATLKFYKGETHGLVFERGKAIRQIITEFLEK